MYLHRSSLGPVDLAFTDRFGGVSAVPWAELNLALESDDDPAALVRVRGQVEVATTEGQVGSVELEPHDPPACPEAVAAVNEADWVVLGPGSWFTSVIPHLLVPGLRTALTATTARVAVTMNLEPQTGETDGFTPEDHLDVLHRQAPDLAIDTVLADHAAVPDAARLRAKAEELGARLVLADVARSAAPGQHDPEKLARAYALVMRAN